MRLIDADKLIRTVRFLTLRDGKEIEIHYVEAERIDSAPTINAEPIKRGRWIFIRDDGGGNSLYSCSECGQGDIQCPEVIVPYCWHCGAKMEAEK